MAELDDLLAQVSDECCLLGGPEPFSPAGAGRAGYPCSHRMQPWQGTQAVKVLDERLGEYGLRVGVGR